MPVVADILQAYRDLGQAQAQGSLAQGRIWGGALQSIGDMAAKYPQEAQQAAVWKYQRDEIARQQAGRQALSAAIKQFTTADPQTGKPQTDHEAVANAVSQAGFPDQANAWLKVAGENSEVLDKLSASTFAHAKQVRETVGDLAYSAKDPESFAAGLGLLASTPGGGLDEQTAHQIADQVTQGGPDALDAVRAKYLPFSPKYQAEQAKAKEPLKVGPDETLTTMERVTSGQPPLVMGGAKPKTEAEMAYAAAGNDPQKALDLLQQAKGETGAKDDQRYEQIVTAQGLGKPVSAEDAAFVKAYTQRKLIGPEATAAAAADRQASSQAQQNAIQKSGQDFQIQKEARDDYAKNVRVPYLTAQSSAQTLRDTVEAAKTGNMVAANLQNLETTMAAIRAQGLNRINTAEIGSTANAGSLWDNVQNWFGKLTKGQPVDPVLEKQILEFADILEKSATLKYQKGRDSILKTYKGVQLPDESAPSTTPQQAPAAPAGWKYVPKPGGGWTAVPDR